MFIFPQRAASLLNTTLLYYRKHGYRNKAGFYRNFTAKQLAKNNVQHGRRKETKCLILAVNFAEI